MSFRTMQQWKRYDCTRIRFHHALIPSFVGITRGCPRPTRMHPGRDRGFKWPYCLTNNPPV